jgi:hypothetical protein
MIDDKPQLLARMKTAMGGELTAVFVRQRHYAAEAASSQPSSARSRSGVSPRSSILTIVVSVANRLPHSDG